MNNPNPCLACGACCALYRASFYWAEADDTTDNGVPVALTEKLNDFFLAMRGTNQPVPRCVALMGIIGAGVRCSIYDRRSSGCREFRASWIEGVPNPRCDGARRHWGLLPLEPSAWDPPMSPLTFPRTPKAA